MSAAAAARAGRSAAERIMADACEIRGPSTLAYNKATKQDDETPGALLYTGKCRVRPTAATQDQEANVGETPVSTWSYIVSIPYGHATAIPVDALVTMTGSADPTLVGQRLRVRQVPQGTHLTARRLVCEVYGG